MQKKVLFIIGSPNQTTQMYAIYEHLKEEYDCWFTQTFPDQLHEKFVYHLGLLKNTIMDGEFRRLGEKFVADHGLQYDYAGKTVGNKYDLVILCTDITFPKVAQQTKSVWVQEGMTDPMTKWAKFIQKIKLPPVLALSTALNGSLNRADVYCASSQGYANFFTEHGTPSEKIFVTGMPNYDNIHDYLNNDFPYKNYVLVCTSDIRETYRSEDRPAFIRDCVTKANGKPIIFKLHPNEKKERAIQEIKENAPANTLVFTDGNINHMIANCDILITQFSTVSYIGMVLGKEVYSYLNIDRLKKLVPLQNGGTSGKRIAKICKNFMEFNGEKKDFYTFMHESFNIEYAL